LPEDQNLRLALLREIPEDANLRLQWNELVARMDRPEVFYTWEWAAAVQRAYHSTLRPLLFLAYDERDVLFGVAALAAEAEGKGCSFLCATTGDYCDFLSSVEHRPAFVAGVLAALKREGIAAVTLTNLPADSATAAALRQASQRNGYHYFKHTAYVCAQVRLSQLDLQSLPRKSVMRRSLNALGREAPVCLDHACSWDAVEPLLGPFIHAHVARFLATGRISNLVRPERRLFLEELAKLLCARGWLDLTRLMSGKQVFAWNYGFRFERTRFWYQPTFDSAFERYSPGFCLLTKLVEEAVGDPELELVDLGLGAEEYKDEFSNQTRETLLVRLNVSAALHYREVSRYCAAALVKTSARGEAAARAIRESWRHIRQRIREQGAFSWLGRRFRELLWSRSEVIFCEWTGTAAADMTSFKVETVNLNDLTSATLQYANDEATLTYLQRAATRVRRGDAAGFGLVDQDGRWVHFAWTTAFDGFFLSELNAKVDPPSPDCVMLFDCWTPPPARGHGYYGHTVTLVAERMHRKGKKPWIFSAASNVPSIRGLGKAGFQRRYSLVRKRVLWWQKISRVPVAAENPVEEVSAHV
jgi:CelD/BcsL family acetyltransferase involved in cellulose biosynthesis